MMSWSTICKKKGGRNDNLQYLQKHDFEQNNKEIVQKNEQRQLKKVLQIEEKKGPPYAAKHFHNINSQETC